MTTRKRNSFYVRSEGVGKEFIIRGIAWLLELAKTDNKKTALLSVPLLSNLDQAISEVLGEKAVKVLKQGKPVSIDGVVSLGLATERKTVFNHSGAVLAVYPNKKLLNSIDDMREVTDILVIPWSMQEVQYWIDTWNARELFGENNVQPVTNFSDPVVEEALKSLTENVNLGTGISHPLDKAKTIDLFRRLKKARFVYDPDEIRGWLVRHGWGGGGRR